MTGEVFAENSEFFFVFEPLLSIVPYQYLSTTDVCKMRNPECRYLKHNWVGGKAASRFGPDPIRTLATDSSHRVIMGKTVSPLFLGGF